MAETQKFFEGPVDQTPYGNCAAVALIVALCFSIAAWGLWNAAGYLKQHRVMQLPTLPTYKGSTDSSGDLLKQVKDAAGNSANDAAAKAKQQAEDAAKAEAQKQLDQQKADAQSSAQNQLQNILPQ